MSIDFSGKQHRVLGVIPARGGSKRLPKKNLKEAAGVSLVGRSAIEAKKTKLIDRIICSTDDLEIANEASRYGIDVPFMRPTELATDTASSVDVILHVVKELPIFDVVVLLQPTSPFRTSQHITAALNMFVEQKADSCVSVSPSRDDNLPRYRIKNGYLDKASHGTLSEDDEARCFSPNGAIYVANVELLKATESFYGTKCAPYFMSESESLDIDTAEDFESFRQSVEPSIRL